MDMLKGEEIAEAKLTDWRKLAQGLHARYMVDDFGIGARFVAAVGEAGRRARTPPERVDWQWVRRPEAGQRRRHLS